MAKSTRTFETTVAPQLPEIQSEPIVTDPRFAPLEDLTKQEFTDARTRSFVANGTPYLPVVGLRTLEAIRIGVMPLPLTEERHYPLNGQLQCAPVVEPLVSAQKRSDGTQVLIRAKISNDGIWPKGQRIYVTGEWENEGEPPSEKPVESIV